MGALAWILGIIGAVLLGTEARDPIEGFLLGGLGGFILGWMIRVAWKMRRLEERIHTLELQLHTHPVEMAVQAAKVPVAPIAKTAPPLAPVSISTEPVAPAKPVAVDIAAPQP